MSRNDGFYKFLFALELALIPIVIFAYLFLPGWSLGLIIAGVFVCKLWREIFKDKTQRIFSVLSAIASIAEFSVLLIFFAVKGFINLPIAIVSVILIVLFYLFKQLYYKTSLPDTIGSVDLCFVIFEFIVMASLIFVTSIKQPVNIALWAIILTAGVSVIYKIYYGFRYESWFSKIKSVFRKK